MLLLLQITYGVLDLRLAVNAHLFDEELLLTISVAAVSLIILGRVAWRLVILTLLHLDVFEDDAVELRASLTDLRL